MRCGALHQRIGTDSAPDNQCAQHKERYHRRRAARGCASRAIRLRLAKARCCRTARSIAASAGGGALCWTLRSRHRQPRIASLHQFPSMQKAAYRGMLLAFPSYPKFSMGTRIAWPKLKKMFPVAFLGTKKCSKSHFSKLSRISDRKQGAAASAAQRRATFFGVFHRRRSIHILRFDRCHVFANGSSRRWCGFPAHPMLAERYPPIGFARARGVAVAAG